MEFFQNGFVRIENWGLLAMAASLCWALVNINDKYILSRLLLKPVMTLVGLGVVGLASSLIIFVVQGLVVPSFSNLLLALLGGVAFALMTYFYLEAVVVEEISRVAPLFYVSPIFILIFSRVFLEEALSLYQYIGLGLLVFGAIGLSLNEKFLPKLNKPFVFMMIAAFFWAGMQIITKYLLSFNDYWTVFAYMRIGTFLVLIPQILSAWPEVKSIFSKQGSVPFVLITLGEGLNLAGILLAAIAASTGPITLVNALSSVQPFFLLVLTLLISFFIPKILKEELSRTTVAIRFGSIALLFTGVLLIG